MKVLFAVVVAVLVFVVVEAVRPGKGGSSGARQPGLLRRIRKVEAVGKLLGNPRSSSPGSADSSRQLPLLSRQNARKKRKGYSPPPEPGDSDLYETLPANRPPQVSPDSARPPSPLGSSMVGRALPTPPNDDRQQPFPPNSHSPVPGNGISVIPRSRSSSRRGSASSDLRRTSSLSGRSSISGSPPSSRRGSTSSRSSISGSPSSRRGSTSSRVAKRPDAVQQATAVYSTVNKLKSPRGKLVPGESGRGNECDEVSDDDSDDEDGPPPNLPARTDASKEIEPISADPQSPSSSRRGSTSSDLRRASTLSELDGVYSRPYEAISTNQQQELDDPDASPYAELPTIPLQGIPSQRSSDVDKPVRELLSNFDERLYDIDEKDLTKEDKDIFNVFSQIRNGLKVYGPSFINSGDATNYMDLLVGFFREKLRSFNSKPRKNKDDDTVQRFFQRLNSANENQANWEKLISLFYLFKDIQQVERAQSHQGPSSSSDIRGSEPTYERIFYKRKRLL